MTVRTLRQLGAMALVFAIGCGDDEGGKKETEQNSLPAGAAADGKVGNSDPEAMIETLNDAEWRAACVDIATAGDNRELAHGACILGGILGKFLEQSCMDTYELCTESEPDVDCDTKPTQCTATLREADACNVAMLKWLSQETKDFTCDTEFSAILSLDQNYVPAECQVVMEKCPEFESSGSVGMGDSDFDEDF